MSGSIRIDIVTALPTLVEEPLQHSILGRAQEAEVATLKVHDLRDHATGRHRQVDARPYGGGGGMVLKPEPLFRAVEAIEETVGDPDDIIYLTPDGERLDQPMANGLSTQDRLVLIAGHYKGIDQRVRDALVTRELSISDVVLSGGELPALMLVDAVVRLVPGALGNSSSALTDAFQDGLLGAPVYTRPSEFRGREVPAVLRSGDHQAIARWRDEKRLEKTRDRRPDLLSDSTDSTGASS
jgi:tRNA (guanine37-N1)-methyltransferase